MTSFKAGIRRHIRRLTKKIARLESEKKWVLVAIAHAELLAHTDILEWYEICEREESKDV